MKYDKTKLEYNKTNNRRKQKKMNQRISQRNIYRCRATHICTYRNLPKTKQNNETKTEAMISAKDL